MLLVGLGSCDSKAPELEVKKSAEHKLVIRTVHHHLEQRATTTERVHSEWLKRVSTFLKTKNSDAFEKYMRVKQQHRAEMASLLKLGKLNKKAALEVHLKTQGKLRNEIGAETHDGYIKLLEEVNAQNHKLGFNATIYL